MESAHKQYTEYNNHRVYNVCNNCTECWRLLTSNRLDSVFDVDGSSLAVPHIVWVNINCTVILRTSIAHRSDPVHQIILSAHIALNIFLLSLGLEFILYLRNNSAHCDFIAFVLQSVSCGWPLAQQLHCLSQYLYSRALASLQHWSLFCNPAISIYNLR